MVSGLPLPASNRASRRFSWVIVRVLMLEFRDYFVPTPIRIQRGLQARCSAPGCVIVGNRRLLCLAYASVGTQRTLPRHSDRNRQGCGAELFWMFVTPIAGAPSA